MFSSLTSALLVASTAFALPAIRQAGVCNGRAELCQRSYGNTTFLMAHNAFADSENPLALGRNQQVDIPTQMDLGVRALQAQSHMKDGVLHLCHTSCTLFDGGPVLDTLKDVKTFLDANINEVFTLLFTNPEGVSVKDVWDPIFKEAGLVEFAYIPPVLPLKASDWPTLGELIDSGKRLVVFMDSNADPAAIPYVLPQFDMIWEPPFSVTDPAFPCSVDRISGTLSVEDHMFMLNHNLNMQAVPIRKRGGSYSGSNTVTAPLRRGKARRGLFDDILGDVVDNVVEPVQDFIEDGVQDVRDILIPAFLEVETTNSLASIIANSDGCSPFAGGKAASFVMLDLVDIGDGMKAVNQLNGFT